MTTLDAVIRSLLHPGSKTPWQSHRADSGLVIRFRAVRLSHGLALAYQPGGVYGPAHCLTLSRPDMDVSPVEVRTVAESLARVLGWPGLHLTTWDERQSDRVQRIYWLPTAVGGQTYQATIYDLDERYEWNWQLMAEGSDRREVARQGWERAAGMVIMKVEAGGMRE